MIPDVRLIDANALQRAFDDAHKDEPDFFCCNFLNNAGNPSTEWECVDEILENAPTIDAQPVKHGKWVDYGSGVGMYCSECRHRIRYRNGIRETAMFSDGEFKFVQYASKNGYYDFCPKCGAKMDGD